MGLEYWICSALLPNAANDVEADGDRSRGALQVTLADEETRRNDEVVLALGIALAESRESFVRS